MQEPENNQSEKPTKSQRKRDVQDLQKLGEMLVGLSDSLLAKIPLPDNLLDSITLARSLKSHEAKRRQLQYIGKIMRNIDVEPIKAAMAKIQSRSEKNTAQFHHIEKWREDLISKGNEALHTFLQTYPRADKPRLSELIDKAQHDRIHHKNTGGETALFRYIRDCLDT